MAKPPDSPKEDTISGVRLSDLAEMILTQIPHAQAIGMSVVHVERAKATIKLPYDTKLIGNPETGVIHGGVVTTLLDNGSGLATALAMDEIRGMATLDLRIDYMMAATPDRDVFAFAHCFRMTKKVAFVRGIAYHDTPDDPIATSSAAFMLDTIGKRLLGTSPLDSTGG